MAPLPTGTVTFLFTDIEGSTTRWERQRQAMQAALARHDAILREAIAAHGGHVFKTVGDAFYAIFAMAPDAVESALAAQQALQTEVWDTALGVLRVRMALHTGGAEERDGDYFGQPLNRVARLLSAGHGGQILLSLATHELVRDHLLPGAELHDLGEHRLRDLVRPERIFQLRVPGLRHDFPPLRTLDNRPNNLPPQPTPLIGREREVEDVRQRLLRPDTRLFTLTGPGGTGKTRLGLQVAAEVLEDFANGVWFVDLTAIADPSLVSTPIAAALGVQSSGGQSVVESVKAYLREKHLLLVLDNFEQLLPAAALVSELLTAAPRLKVLVISRVPLHLRGEREFAVPPLQLPNRAPLPPVELLSQYEAVRLFIERAQDIHPEWRLTNATALAVAEICYRLDGLPLAIELAAARVKALAPDAILARLSNPLKLLTGGPRDAHSRQQTLRATIDWSYHLLEPEEQVLFQRLGVFAGGCTLEAVEAVCNHGGELQADVLDLLQALVDRSLLRPAEGPGNEPRFIMLETIREYALECLAASEEHAALGRHHATYFLALAEQGQPPLFGRTDRWLEQLDAERENLRAAVSWAQASGDHETAAQLAVALVGFWVDTGVLEDGHRVFETVLPITRELPSRLRAEVLWGAGRIEYNRGDWNYARSLFVPALELFRVLGDRYGIAKSVLFLGASATIMGDPEQARGLLEQAVTLFQALGDRLSRANGLLKLAQALHALGDTVQAHALLEESLNVQRVAGDGQVRMLIATLGSLGNVALDCGDVVRARTYAEAALMVARERGSKLDVANSLTQLGDFARYQGNHEWAATLYEEAVELCRETGARGWVIVGLMRLGMIALHRGEGNQAAALFRECVRDLADKQSVAECLLGLAGAAALQGQEMRAARLLGAAEARMAPFEGPPRAPLDRGEYERVVTGIRARLDLDVLASDRSEGRAMPLEQAVAYALEMGDPAS